MTDVYDQDNKDEEDGVEQLAVLMQEAGPLGPDAWELYGQVIQRGCLSAVYFRGTCGRSNQAYWITRPLYRNKKEGKNG